MGIVRSEVEGNGLMSVCRRKMTLEIQCLQRVGRGNKIRCEQISGRESGWQNSWDSTLYSYHPWTVWKAKLWPVCTCVSNNKSREKKKQQAVNQGTALTAAKQTPFGIHPHLCILQCALCRSSHGAFRYHEIPSISLHKPQWASSVFTASLSLVSFLLSKSMFIAFYQLSDAKGGGSSHCSL